MKETVFVCSCLNIVVAFAVDGEIIHAESEVLIDNSIVKLINTNNLKIDFICNKCFKAHSLAIIKEKKQNYLHLIK